LALVFTTETLVVDGCEVRARVKRTHMTALLARLRLKKRARSRRVRRSAVRKGSEGWRKAASAEVLLDVVLVEQHG